MRNRLFSAAASLALASAAPHIASANDNPAPVLVSEDTSIEAGGMATVIVPSGWSHRQQGQSTIVSAPEGDLEIVFVAVTDASDGEAAVAQAWKAHSADFDRSIELSQDAPGRDGWESVRTLSYETSPAEQRAIISAALQKEGKWLVALVDGAIATLAKRGGQVGQIQQSLRPIGFSKENFAGRTAHKLDETRIEEITNFVRSGMEAFDIPGVGLALIEDGKIVFEGGFGVQEVGKTDPVDENTRFMVASNTKGMSTLMLATLVDDGKLDWDSKVTSIYPEFRLGSDETTDQVLMKHLVCACTGLPRKDMQWIFNTRSDTPASDTFVQLAATEPTSGFGEVFQYNNLITSAGGFIGGHLAYPEMEIGAAYDKAMQDRVFDPLGMDSTTFDYQKAMQGNWAKPHAFDFSDNVVRASMDMNETIYPYRPAGGLWSSTHDMALYVINELNRGVLPDGTRMVSEENLMARRVHNVAVGENRWYGMGLFEDKGYGTPVILHGGSMLGYQTNWFAYPESGVGAVILTNSDDGYALQGPLSRKILEVLYDGNKEADENLASQASRMDEARAKARSDIEYPGNADVLAGLASAYQNAELGPLVVRREGGKTFIDTTSISSEIATKVEPDGSSSIITVEPGFVGASLQVGEQGDKRTLSLLDSQHTYVWVEQ